MKSGNERIIKTLQLMFLFFVYANHSVLTVNDTWAIAEKSGKFLQMLSWTKFIIIVDDTWTLFFHS